MDPALFARRLKLLNAKAPKTEDRPENLPLSNLHKAQNVLAEIEMRERVEHLKIMRGWERFPLRSTPKGTPVCLMVGRHRIARLVIDAAGQLRIIQGEKYGPKMTVSEIVRHITTPI